MRPVRFSAAPRDLSRAAPSVAAPLDRSTAMADLRLRDSLPRGSVLGILAGSRRDRVAAYRYARDAAFAGADGIPLDKASGLPITLRHDSVARVAARAARAAAIAERIAARKSRASVAPRVRLAAPAPAPRPARAPRVSHVRLAHSPVGICRVCYGPCRAGEK